MPNTKRCLKINFESNYIIVIMENFADTLSMVKKTGNMYNSMVNELKQNADDIDSELQVKARLIELNNDAAREKNKTIMTIMGSFIALTVGVFAWVGFLGGMFSRHTMFTLFFVAIILFFVMAVFFNKYMLKEYKELSDEAKKKILHAGDRLNLEAIQWVDDNCDCS